MKVGYVRVSSIDQNEQRQIDALKQYDIKRWFIDKVSGKNMTDRPELNKMLEYVREEDTVYVHDLSRLARSTKDLLYIVDELDRKHVILVSNKENINSKTPTGRCMLSMIGAINQLERENILERQREGIAIAKANGVYKGRARKKVDKSLFGECLELYKSRKISKVEFAKRIGVCRNTLDKMIAERMDNE
ncbi:MAG: recombinase family protein [Lachnospiraceae bacterium]|nr:recombinase family protein [Lachnospiraceae bacterium]